MIISKKKDLKIKLLTLDIFDTFLLRNSKPEHLRFYEVSILHCDFFKKNGFFFEPEEVFFYRLLSHNISYRIKNIKEREREGNLNKIFSTMLRCLNISEEFVENLINIEVEYEKKNLRINKKILKIIKTYQEKNNKIKICFVSDMYIPKNKIKELIMFFNKDIKFSDIFVSCDYFMTKKSGSLYDLVIQKLKFSPSEIVHIGDNYETDYINSNKKGINGVYLSRSIFFRFYSKSRKIIFNYNKLANNL